MRIALTGATGVIGQALAAALAQRGDTVVALSRDAQRAREKLGDAVEAHSWPEPGESPPPAEALAGADAVVNLMGEPIAQRWTADAKRRIANSRVGGTRSLVQGIEALGPNQRPKTLVSQSATGFYGSTGDHPVDEQAPAGADFLARVVVEWEQEAMRASGTTRVALTRTGVVLSPSGGALAKMLPFFRLGIGGPVAGGRQYIPWVHLDDVVGAIIHCIENESVDGPMNVTAPDPATNAELSKVLGRVLHRPAVLPVPSLPLKLLYGEMASVVLTGQRAVPAKLECSGYHFRYAELEAALRDVL